MLRVGVYSAGGLAQGVADTLQEHGVEVCCDRREPVALAIAVSRPGKEASADAADVVVTAEDRPAVVEATTELCRDRLAPWARSLASGRPGATAPPHLLAHDPIWTLTAKRRSWALRQTLTRLDPANRLGLRRIDHIGSTAVPGLDAKPFLDLQVTLDQLPDPAALAAAFAPLGWAPAVGARPDSPGVHHDLRQEDDTASDEVFAKRLLVAPDPVRPAILHVRLTASPCARRVVRFRDQLRADPRLRRDYERMKRNAAAAHAGDEDYDDYTRDKGVWLTNRHREADARTGEDPWPLDF